MNKLACLEQACAIQKCLAEHDYQEASCQKIIQQWQDCVERQQQQQQQSKGPQQEREATAAATAQRKA